MRPRKCRNIRFDPSIKLFKPAGTPTVDLQTVPLALDEAEAIRLADYEGLYHEEAGKQMGISRQTFSRVLNTAHQKIADAIINGKCLVIQGSPEVSEDTTKD